MRYELADIDGTAQELVEAYEAYHIWCFYGEMGAGKTTLIKAIGRAVGVQDSMSSPTFAIIQTYQRATGDDLYHFDCYRLQSVEEALAIGAEDYLNDGSWCLIEWPERIKPLIPDRHLEIRLNLVEGNQRELTVVAHG